VSRDTYSKKISRYQPSMTQTTNKMMDGRYRPSTWHRLNFFHGWHWPGHPYLITHTDRSNSDRRTLTSVHRRDLLQELFSKQDTGKPEIHNNRDNDGHIVKSVWLWGGVDGTKIILRINVSLPPPKCVFVRKGGEKWSRKPIHHEVMVHEWWEMAPTHIQISIHIQWFIDRSICTVDIDIDRRSTHGRIRSTPHRP